MNFVKDKTNGLIDKSFDFVERTCFALVNTLYFKDNWLGSGDELSLTQTQYDFETSDGQIIRDYLMQGAYQGGVAQHGENFATFYTSTDGGNRLYFIVPDEGHTLREVFGGDGISFVTGISDWGMAGEGVLNYTRCIFPAFSADYDGDVKDVLKDGFGVEDIFNEDICSLTSLLPDGVNDYGYPVYCSKVQHVAKLVVDRRGVEGAAVTVIPGEGAESADPAVRRLYDFVVDRSFGYVLTDEKFNVLEREDILLNPKGKFHLTDRKGRAGLVLPYDYEDFKYDDARTDKARERIRIVGELAKEKGKLCALTETGYFISKENPTDVDVRRMANILKVISDMHEYLSYAAFWGNGGGVYCVPVKDEPGSEEFRKFLEQPFIILNDNK